LRASASLSPTFLDLGVLVGGEPAQDVVGARELGGQRSAEPEHLHRLLGGDGFEASAANEVAQAHPTHLGEGKTDLQPYAPVLGAESSEAPIGDHQPAVTILAVGSDVGEEGDEPSLLGLHQAANFLLDRVGQILLELGIQQLLDFPELCGLHRVPSAHPAGCGEPAPADLIRLWFPRPSAILPFCRAGICVRFPTILVWPDGRIVIAYRERGGA